MASSSSSSSCRVLASQAFRQSRLHFYYFSSVAGFTATSFRPRFLLASSLFSESFRCRHGVSSVSSDPGPLPFPGTYYSKPSAVHEKAGVYARPIASGFGKYSRRGISTEVRPDEGASSGESASSEGTPYDGSTSHDAQGAEQPSQENSKSAEGPYEEKLDEKKQVLRAALAHVHTITFQRKREASLTTNPNKQSWSATRTEHVYRLCDPTMKKVVSSRDVKFDESTFPGLKDERGHEIFTLLPIQQGDRGHTSNQNAEPQTPEQQEAED